MRRRRLAGLIAVVLVLSGCATTGSASSGSRDELYDSVAAISAASALVIVGRVTLQEHTDDPQPTTVSTLELVERFVPTGLGDALPPGTPLPDKMGSVVQVRQVVEPSLVQGQSYLLFLTPSGLPGDAAGQYFPTGGTAGVYDVVGTNFVHGEFTEGDTLPSTLTAADLG